MEHPAKHISLNIQPSTKLDIIKLCLGPTDKIPGAHIVCNFMCHLLQHTHCQKPSVFQKLSKKEKLPEKVSMVNLSGI